METFSCVVTKYPEAVAGAICTFNYCDGTSQTFVYTGDKDRGWLPVHSNCDRLTLVNLNTYLYDHVNGYYKYTSINLDFVLEYCNRFIPEMAVVYLGIGNEAKYWLKFNGTLTLLTEEQKLNIGIGTSSC